MNVPIRAAVATASLLPFLSFPAAETVADAEAGLSGFADCESLRAWYVDTALPQVGPWGWNVPYLMYDTAGAVRSQAADAGKGVSNSATGTNVQEVGVDEPDLAKTDGSILVRVRGTRLAVVDVTGERPRELSRTMLPGNDLGTTEVLLVGSTVLALSTEGRPFGARTHITRLDVSDPAHPQVLSHQRVDGSLVEAREYGDGTTRVVVGTDLPELDFVRPSRTRTPGQARLENRAIVRATPVETWLPGLRQGDGRGRHPLLDCTAVLHPRTSAGFGTLSVLTFAATDPRSLSATAILADGDLAYSSADRFYVATLDQSWWEDLAFRGSAGLDEPRSTEVHAFALDGATTSYVASGEVPGSVRDRWSFSQHAGVLRVATALGRGWQPRENAVHTLVEEGDRLRNLGRVDGLGPREQIQSVRWLGDLAVVVTFRQVDPLYTLDLGDPTSPRLLGALKIPGFSSYLHPLGGDLLLGLGEDATRRGVSTGGQAAVFDLTDPRHVTRTDTLALARSDRFATAWEPRAFTWLPESRLVLAPVETWGRHEGVRLLALHVGREGGVSRVGSWPLGHWEGADVRALPLPDGRVAVTDYRTVRLVEVDDAT